MNLWPVDSHESCIAVQEFDASTTVECAVCSSKVNYPIHAGVRDAHI
jgi:hypothetical protein